MGRSAYAIALPNYRAGGASALPMEQQAGLKPALDVFSAQSIALALTGGQNQGYSPVSLWLSLAMLAESTGGESRAEILSTLGAEDLEQLRGWVGTLWHDLYTDENDRALLPANSIWLSQSVPFHRSVLDTLAVDYYAGSYQAPMGTPEADNALSQWVSDQTRGLIGSEGPVLETQATTMAVLASTLYYKADWQTQFLPELTAPDTFTASDGTSSTVDFMHLTLHAPFLRREGYQAAALATSLGEMVFVLPDQGVELSSLLADTRFLPSLDISGADAQDGEVQWSLPKFDLSSPLELQPVLEGMGVVSAFDPESADFSPLSERPMWLEQANQIAQVKVDENGVESAAVTLMATGGSPAPPMDPEICVMDLDRPFFFLIRSDSGIVLFAGVVVSL